MIFSIFLFTSLFFGSEYSKLYNVSNKSIIKAFSKDLSNLTSSSIFYSARTLGFSGFSLNYKSSYILKPSSNDKLLNEGSKIDLIQFETGLPYRFDTFIRAGGNNGYNFIGGGLKYGLKNVTDEIYGINLSFSVYSHMGIYKDFYILTTGSQLLISMKLSNRFIPFMGGGVDTFKFKIKSHSDNFLIGKTIDDEVYKSVFGLRLKFGWLNIATSYELITNGMSLVSGIAGIRF